MCSGCWIYYFVLELRLGELIHPVWVSPIPLCLRNVVILELISPVPHDSLHPVILVSRDLTLRVVPPLMKGRKYLIKTFDWLAKMTLTYHLRAGG